MGLSMWDIWERAENGPICPVKMFETRVLFCKAQELAKTYEINYEPETLIPTDDTLIDNVYQAALQLLLDVGVLCSTTERIIKFDEQEVKNAIRLAPREVKLGEGKDAITIVHRGIEDKRMPVILGGPIAVPISETIIQKVYEAYAREPSLDIFEFGTPAEIGGIVPKAGTPLEMHAEKMNVTWMRDAFRRAGRPGVHIQGSMAVTPTATIGACNPEWGYRTSDSIHCWIMPQMKTDYYTLCRAEHYHYYGCLVWAGGTPLMGGLAGGPGETVIVAVAEALAAFLVYQADLLSWVCMDTLYPPGASARKCIWANSLANAALARHTNFVSYTGGPYQAYAGPCTDMYLYEIAASTVAVLACGSASTKHGGGRCGAETDYFGGPLDTRFLRDLGYAAARLKREDANEIVKAVLAKYEDRIRTKNPPLGKKFQDCNDLKTLKPTKEYLDLYDKIKKELEDLGLEFE
jgi:methylamine--corrinoid protein Co-methyltransferase